MTGEPGNPGVLPRSLVVLFNSIAEVQAQKYVSKEHAHKGRKQPTYGWGRKQPVNPSWCSSVLVRSVNMVLVLDGDTAYCTKSMIHIFVGVPS